MSGIKSADVKEVLDKLVSVVRNGVQECERAAAEAGAVGRGDCERAASGARRVHEGLQREWPVGTRELLAGETGQWEALLEAHDKSYAAATALFDSAAEQEGEFRSRKEACDRRLEEIDAAVKRIRGVLRNKNWWCENEDKEARALRQQAKQVLSEMRKNVRLGRQAQELRRQALARFAESDSLAQEAEREYRRLSGIADERRERQRIREENERRAMNLQSDLESLRQAIESKEPARFGGELYTHAVRKEIEEVLRLIGNRSFEKALPRAEALKGVLADAAAKIDAARRAWETGKVEAERTLADAREEAARLGRDVLATYSGAKAADIDGTYREIEAAAGDLAGERFGEATARAAAAVARLREWSDLAAENRRLARQREEMATAIMQAFCDARFDTPSYYLQDEGDSLSDMCIVAAAPGGVGDMRLRIRLDGETKFDVGNIPDGQEQLCIAQVRSLQERLAASDIHFDVTDWGRAANPNRTHVDTRPKQTEIRQSVQRQG